MKRLHLAALLLVTVGAASAADQRRIPQPRVPTPEERAPVRSREMASREAGARHLGGAIGESALLPGSTIDVESYTIDLQVSLSPDRVDGTVLIEARSLTAGLTSMVVGLHSQLGITSIATGVIPLSYSRAGGAVTITLDRPYAVGELIQVAITYGGTPPITGFGGQAFDFDSHSTGPIISSLSEDEFATAWWPCVDVPSDKAIVSMDLTVPAGLVGVSNGVLAGTVSGPGTETFQWRHAHPISTYLVSVAISNYVMLGDTYTPVTGGPDMPVQHWVYPQLAANAAQDFIATVPMLEFFSSTFGEYPYVNEKYGHALFTFGGAMEHPTVSSYGAGLIRGDNLYDWVVAHELAHQWFGDMVTLAGWPEIWLNEGFASYSEALWAEHLGGAPALRNWMLGVYDGPYCGTVYDPEGGGCQLFGNTVYDKGAWVLHMLRGVVGDADFFQGVRDYVTGFAYSNASTQELRAVMEAASGRDLAGFFDRWVYQSGEPVYQWGWSAASTPAGWVTYVHIDQTQPGAPFIMPIDLRIQSPSGGVTVTVESTGASQDFALPPVASQPTGVLFDPDLWILKTSMAVPLGDSDADGVPDTADNCPEQSNAAQADLDADDLGDPCDPDLDGDGRDNAADCAPADPTAQQPPAEVTGVVASGDVSIRLDWDPDPGGSATYDALRGGIGDLLPQGGTAGAVCFAPGLPVTHVVDSDSPAPGEGVYYLIRSINACGTGTLGTDWSGSPRQGPACQ